MAKAKAAKKKNPKAPAPNPLVVNRKRRHARKVARRNPGPTPLAIVNPPMGQDFVNVLLPGFAAYAATRVLARIVYQLVQKRWPKLGKHAAAISGVASFGAVWLTAHRVQTLAKYHDGVVMGSGIAAFQGLATTYLPDKYKWLIADCKPEDVAPVPAKTEPATAPATQTFQARAEMAPAPEPTDEFSYLEDELQLQGVDVGRRRESPGKEPAPAQQRMDDLDDALLGALETEGDSLDDLYS